MQNKFGSATLLNVNKIGTPTLLNVEQNLKCPVRGFHLGILEVGDETEMEEASDCVSQGVHPSY
jgi:hypothetical protein